MSRLPGTNKNKPRTQNGRTIRRRKVSRSLLRFPLAYNNHVSIFMLREQHKHRLSRPRFSFERGVWRWEPQRYVSTPPTRAPRWTLRGAAPHLFPLELRTQTDDRLVVCRGEPTPNSDMHVRIRARSYGCYKRRYVQRNFNFDLILRPSCPLLSFAFSFARAFCLVVMGGLDEPLALLWKRKKNVQLVLIMQFQLPLLRNHQLN